MRLISLLLTTADGEHFVSFFYQAGDQIRAYMTGPTQNDNSHRFAPYLGRQLSILHCTGSARRMTCLSFASLTRIAVWPASFTDTGLSAKSATVEPNRGSPMERILSAIG